MHTYGYLYFVFLGFFGKNIFNFLCVCVCVEISWEIFSETFPEGSWYLNAH